MAYLLTNTKGVSRNGKAYAFDEKLMVLLKEKEVINQNTAYVTKELQKKKKKGKIKQYKAIKKMYGRS